MCLTNDEKNIILTKSGNNYYRVYDILNILKSLGIKNGDTICIHSQLFGLGIPKLSKELFMDLLVKIFKYIVGENGTIIMPTFSYSFCKNEIFDINNTPSTVGVLTEYFRNLPNVSRTMHPIFSFAVYGKKRNEFMNTGLDAFSKDSVYGKMLNNNDKIIMFGAPKGYTFYYLAEQYVGVKHRFFKYFEGIVKNGTDEINLKVPYYVRHLDMKSEEDENKVNNYLNNSNIQKTIKIAKGSISAFNCKDMFESCVNKLKEDDKYFLKD